MSNAVAAPALRKLCPSCVREDVLLYGESYWHLSHQLPGVLACVRHGAALRETAIPFKAPASSQLALPLEGRGSRIRLSSSAVISVAIESIELLQRQQPEQRSAAFYRALAQSRGYLAPERTVSEAALGQLLLRRFSAQFLQGLGLLDEKRMPSWAALMFRPNVAFGYAPIKHVLLQVALSLGPVEGHDLSHRPSGPPESGDDVVDAHYSRAAKQALSQALQQERVLTTEQFLRVAGCYGAYKHRKDRMPRLRQIVLAFRNSAASVKPLSEGRILFRTRPREVVAGGAAPLNE